MRSSIGQQEEQARRPQAPDVPRSRGRCFATRLRSIELSVQLAFRAQAPVAAGFAPLLWPGLFGDSFGDRPGDSRVIEGTVVCGKSASY
jgi:hypothetical protein